MIAPLLSLMAGIAIVYFLTGFIGIKIPGITKTTVYPGCGFISRSNGRGEWIEITDKEENRRYIEESNKRINEFLERRRNE